MNSYKDYYNKQLQEALEYQDFVAEQLYKIGLPLFNYASRKYQYKFGENKLGVEIKYDKKFKNTGNLWIELKEKSDPKNVKYINSGIHRNDGCWLYVIGNKEKFFIFSKNLLGKISHRYRPLENSTKTSIGFLMPEKDALKYSAKTITIPQRTEEK